jgi:hypothetical protein
VESTLKKYGGMLMEQHPDETTDLLKALCTDYRPIASSFINDVNGRSRDAANAEDFLHVFTDHPGHMKDFLLYIDKTLKRMSPVLYAALMQVLLLEWSNGKFLFKLSPYAKLSSSTHRVQSFLFSRQPQSGYSGIHF